MRYVTPQLSSQAVELLPYETSRESEQNAPKKMVTSSIPACLVHRCEEKLPHFSVFSPNRITANDAIFTLLVEKLYDIDRDVKNWLQ